MFYFPIADLRNYNALMNRVSNKNNNLRTIFHWLLTGICELDLYKSITTVICMNNANKMQYSAVSGK